MSTPETDTSPETPAATSAPEIDPRVAARDAIHRFLGEPTGNASQTVETLDDPEVAEIVVAAGDRQTARSQIKRILTRAYDRRSSHAAEEARTRNALLRRRAQAQAALERGLSMPPGEAHQLAAALPESDQRILAELAGDDPDNAPIIQAVVDRHLARHAADLPPVAEASTAEEPAAVIPAGDEEDDTALADETNSSVSETIPAAAETPAVSPETEAPAGETPTAKPKGKTRRG